MVIKIKYNIVYLTLKTDKCLKEDASKLRGYIGNQFYEFDILHNHINNKLIFSYPLVQYKIIDGNAHILGIEEGGEVLKKISSELSELKLFNEYKIVEKIIHEKEVEIKPSRDEKHYKFITPWLGLNQKNYSKYINEKNWKVKKEILNKTLVGNILSMSKSLGIIINKRLYVKSHFNQNIVEFKGIKMNSFIGEFKVHFDIPDYFGLGKGVSRGFGCVKQIIHDYPLK